MLAMLPFALLGTWVPDWDLFLGIGFHRSPITHSALPVILIALFTKPFSSYAVVVGFGLGVASHLFWDVVEYGNVHWIPGGFLDRAFLVANAGGLVLWAWFKEVEKPKTRKKRTKKKKRLTEPDAHGGGLSRKDGPEEDNLAVKNNVRD
jgi:hypothetical protein